MKYKYIDALRGVAILMVIAIHTFLIGSNHINNVVSSILYSTQRGVQLFFVASAFTLFLSGSRRVNEAAPITNFFIRRFFRIAPLYYLAIFYYLWQNQGTTNYWLGGASHITTGNIISNFFFSHGFYPYWFNSLVPGGWSITVEMMFYCLVPILIKYITSLNKAVSLFVFSVSLSYALTRILNHYPVAIEVNVWKDYLSLYFPSQFPVFTIGIISFMIVIKKDYKISAVNVLLLATLLFFHLVIGKVISDVIFFAIAFGLLLIAVSLRSFSVVVNRFTIFFGKISYSAYIIQFAIFYWLNKFSFVDFVSNPYANYSIRYAIVIILVSVLASVMYNFVEVPMQKLGNKLINILGKKETGVVVS